MLETLFSKNSLSVQKSVVIFLVLILVLKIAVLWINQTPYWHDERVVTIISKQPFFQLLDTVKAEPHPPGFYILLKAFPVDNQQLTKLIFVVFHGLSTLLIVSVLLFSKKTSKRLTKSELWPSYGLLLFFSSANYFSISTEIKQDIVSFPTVLFGLVLLIRRWQFTATKETISRLETLFLFFIAFSLLLLGYLHYLFFIFFTGLMLFFLKQSKTAVIFLSSQIVITIGYLVLFGFEQLVINVSRFSWVDNFPHSIFFSIESIIADHNVLSPTSDFAVFILLFLLFSVGLSIQKKETPLEKKIIFLCSLVFFGGAYILKLTVQPRYMSVLFLLICIICGWQLQKLDKKIKMSVLLLFFTLGLSAHISRSRSFTRYNTSYTITNEINQFISQPTALLYRETHAINRLDPEFTTDPNITVHNLFYPYFQYSLQTISKDELMIHGVTDQIEKLSDDEIVTLLKQSGFSNFVVLFQKNLNEQVVKMSSAYENRLSLVLSQYCSSVTFLPLQNDTVYLSTLFEGCSF